MDELEDKISKEKSRYKKIEIGTMWGGILLIALGVTILLIIPEYTLLARTVTTALYFGIGGSLIVKSITTKQDLARNINELKMDNKLDKILSIITEKVLTKNEPSKEKIKSTEINFAHVMEEWKIVIQTQMHFNDLLMKVRTASLSIVLVIFGAAGYSTLSKDTILLTIQNYTFHPSVIIISSGLVILFSMFMIDYKYYYRLLVGAVKRGWEFDDKFGNDETWKYFGLTTTISKEIGEKNRGSGRFVIGFYMIPFGAGVIFLLAVLFGFPQ